MTDDRESAWGSPTICEVLRKRYAVHLIVLLGLHGPFRFTSILDQIETVSSATISKRLDALIEAGLVERTEYDGHLRVEYSLTERGQDLCAQLDSDLIGALVGKHTFRIICWVGEQGPIRYMEIKRGLEITTDSTLSTRLEALCDAGLLDRTSYDEVPPHVEYSLTDRGTELYQALQDVSEM